MPGRRWRRGRRRQRGRAACRPRPSRRSRAVCGWARPDSNREQRRSAAALEGTGGARSVARPVLPAGAAGAYRPDVGSRSVTVAGEAHWAGTTAVKEPMTDTFSATASLLARATRGDERAWADLVEQHTKLLYAVARSFRLDSADA